MFSQKNKKAHLLIVTIYLMWLPLNSLLLLETENLIWAATLIPHFAGIVFFKQSSDYKTKYLSD
ncbi:hypothetical protein [Photobacterium gaetbulicola]|uniref:Uncharacterized protein n=2 Tax=Photobacterium gaetbulicola TaxID=1295392 RepID=A0A0C4JN07_9GAMM|nr:hypothetical protein [Photobacterium gaetbulicola]AHA59189.1 hypothetical protein H744_p0100 [Photobacterium gaetbulicola Gung47]